MLRPAITVAERMWGDSEEPRVSRKHHRSHNPGVTRSQLPTGQRGVTGKVAAENQASPHTVVHQR